MAEVIDLARAHTKTAIAALARIAGDEEQPPAAIVAASIALLERGWGKPVQPTEVSGPGGGPVQVEDTRESLAAILARVEATISPPPETQH